MSETTLVAISEGEKSGKVFKAEEKVRQGINASVHTMTANDKSSFLYYLKSKSEVADLKHKLKSDDYILDSERVAAFEILDNDSYDAVIFAYEVYVNSSNDTVKVDKWL